MSNNFMEYDPMNGGPRPDHLKPVEPFHHPAIESLGLTMGEHSANYPLVHLEVPIGATVLVAPPMGPLTDGSTSKPRITSEDINWTEDRWHWQETPNREAGLQGFLRGLYQTNDGRAFLHVEYDVTDIGYARVGVMLDDIDALSVHSDEAHSVWAAFQNACVDGDSTTYQLVKGLPLDVTVTAQELEDLIESHWPTPELVFQK